MEELKPEAYFAKLSTINNLDIFVKKNFKELVIDTISEIQDEGDIEIYGYVVMPDHISLVIHSDDTKRLDNFCQTVRRKVSQRVMDLLMGETQNDKRWLLFLINFINNNSDSGVNRIWSLDCQLKPLTSRSQLMAKLDSMHFTPVHEGFVSKPEEYVFSSAHHNIFERRRREKMAERKAAAA